MSTLHHAGRPMTTARLPLENTRPPPPEVSPRAVAVARRILSPVEAFLNIEAASGVILLAMTAAALAIANSGWGPAYGALLDTPFGVTLSSLHAVQSLRFWVNDGLMTIFFFVVGLEIRREMHDGTLSTARGAALPVAAALGGMIVPAVLYVAVTAGSTAARGGWAVPIATDIAFALGALTLLGQRVPPALRVLLLAVAMIDDVVSIAVIAFFYSDALRVEGLGIAFAGVGAILILQRLGIRRALLYVMPGVVVWVGVLHSGVHPTIAGVVLGLLTPARAWLGPEGLIDAARDTVQRIERELATGVVGEIEAEALARETMHLERIRREAMAPAARLQLMLHPWVAFVIMPIFALTNAGVSLRGGASFGALSLGILVGFLVGKPLGIVWSSLWLARARLITFPSGIGKRHVLVLGLVASIGFTMALFVAALAFDAGPKLEEAKVAILTSSFFALCVAAFAGRWVLRPGSVTREPRASPGAVSRETDHSL